jgi:geranylgeranyl pyrophosphate synthase
MGNASAVMLGDLLVARAFGLCASLAVPRFSQLIAATLGELCEGEAEQIAHRGRWRITPAEYLQVVDRKTASLTAVACRLGAEASGAAKPVAGALARYGRKVGTAFQVVDDVLDLVGQADALGKALGQDLARGDLTLPVIHYLACDQARIDQVRAAVEGTDADRAALTRALARAGSIEYAQDTARQYVREALAALEDVPASGARDKLAALAEFVLTRRN